MATLELPELEDGVTYVVGSKRAIDLFVKNKKSRKIFEKDLRAMDDIVVYTDIVYEVETNIKDDYIYVLDSDGMQLVIAMEWVDEKNPIDFSRFDA